YIFVRLETEFRALPRSQTEFVNEMMVTCSLNLLRFTPMRRGGVIRDSPGAGAVILRMPPGRQTKHLRETW
ncbi:MAG: hypothetical protein D6681_13035, partial [Calditrichaeota bacterium]